MAMLALEASGCCAAQRACSPSQPHHPVLFSAVTYIARPPPPGAPVGPAPYGDRPGARRSRYHLQPSPRRCGGLLRCYKLSCHRACVNPEVTVKPSSADDDAVSATAAAVLRVRLADPRDAGALAALDAACAADGSSGWTEGIYRADLQPGGPNLILLCERTPPPPPPPLPPPPPHSASAAVAAPADVGTAVVVALAAGCEAAGEVSLTNLAVAVGARGGGLGRRMAAELLQLLGAERYPTFLEVRRDNAVAQALYGKLGFETAGLRRRYNSDGSDSLVMVRQPGPLQLLPPPS